MAECKSTGFETGEFTCNGFAARYKTSALAINVAGEKVEILADMADVTMRHIEDVLTHINAINEFIYEAKK